MISFSKILISAVNTLKRNSQFFVCNWKPTLDRTLQARQIQQVSRVFSNVILDTLMNTWRNIIIEIRSYSVQSCAKYLEYETVFLKLLKTLSYIQVLYLTETSFTFPITFF